MSAFGRLVLISLAAAAVLHASLATCAGDGAQAWPPAPQPPSGDSSA